MGFLQTLYWKVLYDWFSGPSSFTAGTENLFCWEIIKFSKKIKITFKYVLQITLIVVSLTAEMKGEETFYCQNRY